MTDLASLPLVEELSAAQLEQLLGRRHGWARRHVLELGGYRDGGAFRFPVHGVIAWQRAQAEAYAQERRAS